MKKLTFLLFVVIATTLNAQLTVTQLWNFSVQEGNGTSVADDVKNGIAISPDGTKLYCSTRLGDNKQVAVYNPGTGVRTGYLPNLAGFASIYGGDVAVDGNGAIYACNVIISAAALIIAKWDNATATPTTFISTTAHTGDGSNRVGYGMDVRVDANGDGFIVMHKNGSANFLIWTITNNTPDSQDPTILTATMVTGVAITDLYGRISIIDDNSFWFDGNATRPQLVTITKGGSSINSTPTALSYTTLGYRTDVNIGVGGATEFTLGGSRYLVVAANNHSTAFTAAPKHSAHLQKLQATGVAVDGSVITTLPSAGLGGSTDGSHFVESVVYVDGNDAYIYVVGGLNGIAAFKASLPPPPTKTFTVTAPSGTEHVYIAGSFSDKNWDISNPHELTATGNPNEYSGSFPCVDGVEYKYLNGKANWDYGEAKLDGEDLVIWEGKPAASAINRSYNAADVVKYWVASPKVNLTVTISENSGEPSDLFVKGGWNGWTDAVALSKQSEKVFTGSIGNGTSDVIYSNTEYKYLTSQLGPDNWEQRNDNRWMLYPAMNDEISKFLTEIPFTTVENIKSDIKIMRTSTGISVVLDGNMNSIELYNMKGVLMERTQASGSYTRDLESGAYILRINGVGHKFVR